MYPRSVYVSDPLSQYSLLGIEKPYVLPHPSSGPLTLVVDARLVGNEMRFIRRSCRPNCCLRSVVVDSGEDEEMGEVEVEREGEGQRQEEGNGKEESVSKVRLAIFATRAVGKGEELTLPWSWDPDHICSKPPPPPEPLPGKKGGGARGGQTTPATLATGRGKRAVSATTDKAGNDALTKRKEEKEEEREMARIYTAVLSSMECACHDVRTCRWEAMRRWLGGWKATTSPPPSPRSLAREAMNREVGYEEDMRVAGAPGKVRERIRRGLRELEDLAQETHAVRPMGGALLWRKALVQEFKEDRTEMKRRRQEALERAKGDEAMDVEDMGEERVQETKSKRRKVVLEEDEEGKTMTTPVKEVIQSEVEKKDKMDWESAGPPSNQSVLKEEFEMKKKEEEKVTPIAATPVVVEKPKVKVRISLADYRKRSGMDLASRSSGTSSLTTGGSTETSISPVTPVKESSSVRATDENPKASLLVPEDAKIDEAGTLDKVELEEAKEEKGVKKEEEVKKGEEVKVETPVVPKPPMAMRMSLAEYAKKRAQLAASSESSAGAVVSGNQGKCLLPSLTKGSPGSEALQDTTKPKGEGATTPSPSSPTASSTTTPAVPPTICLSPVRAGTKGKYP
ncbi:hypothetical protein BJ684DRAFT_22152 [Piptocephalis cylindrospora]|uniref:SET domain-containing protein n=1 Tax=Piptocephalis cylindrospora TaxID=1907219 RepID=A0A4P9XY09_9FUNG|nr:hypothetical protein BJ684DRAFT_22152 [Piptocephalis cylindrospora]|eukprot:RKP11296.1 hypothetical protein BJ684DRAFT_22152 [Piptocephalis cylindrospora]